MSLLPYQERVIEEKRELDEKLDRLRVYMGSPAFTSVPTDEQARMGEQASFMAGYSRVLGARIAAFKS